MKNPLRNIRNIRRIVLKNFLYVCVYLLIPLIGLNLVYQAVNLNGRGKEFLKENDYTFQTCKTYVNDLWKSTCNIGWKMLSNRDVQALVSLDRQKLSHLLLTHIRNIKERLFIYADSSETIYKIYLYIGEAPYYISETGSMVSLNAPSSVSYFSSYGSRAAFELLATLHDQPEDNLWITDKAALYCYLRPQKNSSDFCDCLLQLNTANLSEALSSYLGETQSLIVRDKFGEELIRVGDGAWAEPTDGLDYRNGHFFQVISGCLDPGWEVRLVSRESRFESVLRSVVWESALMTLAILDLGLLLCGIVTMKVSKPYRVIEQLLNQPVQEAISRYPTEYALMDDLGIIKDLIYQSKYQLYAAQNELESRGHLLNNARIVALQAQINPHFLYNTLESIKWKVLRQFGGRDNEISEMICDLSTLMRLSLDNNRSLIPLREEVEHARLYIKLQMRRFPNRFDVEWVIPDELLATNVIPLTLHPLLENAISHGVKKMNKPGLIRVVCRAEDENVFICVCDNGPGFSDDALRHMREILAQSVLHTSDHVGLFNVHQRLKLTFTGNCGVLIDSKPYVETRITMCFPRDEKIK